MLELTMYNNIKIPQIGFGVYQLMRGKTTCNAVLEALADGYRHIDTAKIYGNEKSVGKAIKECGLSREQIFVTTKMWNSDITARKGKKAFLTSLKNLGLEYVDLYLLHWSVDGYIEAYKTLIELYNEGKIRAIGVSNFLIRHLEEIKKQGLMLPMVNQIEVNPQFSNDELVDYCKKNNIIVESWSPLGGSRHNVLDNEVIKRIAEKHSVTPSQVVIRWHIERGLVVLPRSKNPIHIKENFDVEKFSLDEEDMKLMKSLNINIRTGGDPEQYK